MKYHLNHTLIIGTIWLFLLSCSTPRVQITTIHGVTEPAEAMTENPFFSPSPLLLEAPDFNNIRTEDYLPAFEEGMSRQLEEIEVITSNTEPPSFENTIVALEKSGEIYRRVSRVFFNMTSAHTNEQLQQIQSELAPRLADHTDNIRLNSELFERITTVYDQRSELELDPESDRLLEETYRNFIRAGARLDATGQEEIRRINERISTLTTRFQEELLTMTRERSVVVENRADLDGLGEDRIAAAKQAAVERGHQEGYLLTITNTTRQPILANLNNRELRQRIWEASAFRGRGLNDGVDTRPLVLELVDLRARRATLLGYGDWASYILEPQTAGTPGRVLEMIRNMIPDVVANTDREATLIRQEMAAAGIDGEVRPWDWEYFAERVRRQRYQFDEEEVRPYFELERVLNDGVFHAMERLYGITFEERADLPVYHPEVRVFDVISGEGARLGLFYIDLFERDSKRGGAWMSSFVAQSHLLEQRPVVINVLNIPKPAEGEPALVSFDHVTTLFHEMGHAVHGLFSEITYPSLSGTSVPRDFVEFPSTFHEDWAIHPEVLSNYAVHYETGEQIPAELLDRVIAAREFNQGFDTQEYLAATVVDLEWHLLGPDETPDNVEEFERAALAAYGLDVEAVPPRYRSPYFAHIFAGGYSASYYAYIWSEVLAADAFAFMKDRNGLTRENGEHFRQTILSRGGSRNAMDLYLDFRGDEPDVRHLLRRRGLQTD